MPLLSATLFLRSIFSPSSSLYEWLASLTSIFSLAATAYGMNQRASLHQSRPGGMSVSGTDYIVIAKRWLLPVNAAFCVLLGLVYILVSFTEPLPNTRPVLYFVPGGTLPLLKLFPWGQLLTVYTQPCLSRHWLHKE